MEMALTKSSGRAGVGSFAAVFALSIILLSFVAAGCVNSAQNSPAPIVSPSGAADTGAKGQTPSSPGGIDNVATPPPPPSPPSKNDAVIAENKTGFDKTQETIALAIADGTYVGDVTYAYHSGNETMKVSVTVKNDIVTDASIAPVGTPANYSLKLMNAVNAELPNLVVGKKITELNIPKNVAGSSLTTAAFKAQLASLVEKY